MAIRAKRSVRQDRAFIWRSGRRLIAAQLISRQAETNIDADDAASTGDQHRVDVDSLQLVRPRTVGVEHVALWAMQQVGLPALLAQLGLNSRQQAAAVGSIIGRLAAPGSERATHRWLRDTSALGDLLDVDFENYSQKHATACACIFP